MDISNKVRELKDDIQKIASESKIVANRITELKFLVDEKKKKETELADLKLQEAALIKELGL